MSRDAFSDANSKLMTIFKFTLEDLEFNKAEKMSESQIKNQEQKMNAETKIHYKIVHAVIIVTIVGVASILLTSEKARQNGLTIILGFGVMGLIYYFWIRLNTNHMYKKNKKNLSLATKVECFSGEVELISKTHDVNYRAAPSIAAVSAISGYDVATDHIIKIASENINVDPKTMAAFENGKKYNIYTVKLPPVGNAIIRTIISAEQTD